jgi:hypothetical protein
VTALARSAGQAGFAAAVLDPDLPSPSDLCSHDGTDPSSRFAIYRNNVVSGLVGALAETFPVTRALVGAEFFGAMAAVFVRRSPPTSCVLAYYGKPFVDFIASFGPARSVPYLADVARLEMARVEAYHECDAEPVNPARVGAAMVADIEQLRLEIHPSVRVVASAYAVASIWASHQVDGDVDLGRFEIEFPEIALVCRASLDVVVVPLASGADRFIGILMDSGTLGDAAAIALAYAPGLNVAVLLAMLFANGAVTGFIIPSETSK